MSTLPASSRRSVPTFPFQPLITRTKILTSKIGNITFSYLVACVHPGISSANNVSTDPYNSAIDERSPGSSEETVTSDSGSDVLTRLRASFVASTFELAKDYLDSCPGPDHLPANQTPHQLMRNWLYTGDPPQAHQLLALRTLLDYRLGVMHAATTWATQLQLHAPNCRRWDRAATDRLDSRDCEAVCAIVDELDVFVLFSAPEDLQGRGYRKGVWYLAFFIWRAGWTTVTVRERLAACCWDRRKKRSPSESGWSFPARYP